MNRKPLLTLVILAGLLLGACSPAAPAAPTATPTPAASPTPQSIVVTDGLGRQVTLPGPAQRVASMAPSNTEILYAIGAGSQVVGRDEFSDYPAEAAGLTTIGGSFGGYNNEAIVGLKPDLVLAAEINTPEQVQALEKLGVTVYYLSNPKDMEGMYQNLLTVAALTGRQAEAQKLVDALKGRVAAVEQKLKDVTERPVVFYEIDSTDPNAPYTAGEGTFIDMLLGMAGGENLGRAMQDAYGQMSLEELVVKDPDIILLGDSVWGGVTPEMVAQRAGWEKLGAVQGSRVYPFDDNLVSRPGPRMVDGLESLAKLLHPELFE